MVAWDGVWTRVVVGVAGGGCLVPENSECVINLYRNNSGTSSQYEGDSTQNIGKMELH